MIIMKKKFNIIIIITILLMIISIVLILHFTRNNNLTFIVFQKHYSLLYEEYPEFEISVYASNDKSEYFKDDYIDSGILYNNEDSYNVKVVNSSESIKTKIKDKIYYEKKLTIKLDIDSSSLININNANLRINYITGEHLTIKVGNLNFLKAASSEHLKIHKVQAIVNDFGLYDSLSGIILSISSEEECQITNMTPISTTVNINNNYLFWEETIEYDHNKPLKEIFGDNYDSFNVSTKGFKTIKLNKNSKKDVMIPLYYIQNEYVDSLGIIVEYEINSVKYYQLVNPYKLYQSHKLTYFINEYKISKD